MNFINPNASPTQMATKRRLLLSIAMISFIVWQSCQIAFEIVNPLGRSGAQWDLLDAARGFGLGMFTASMIGIFFFIQRLHERPRLAAMLNDELFHQNRLKAGFFAFFCTLAAVSVVIAYSAFRPLSALIGGNITILVGCTSFLGSTIFLDRD